MSIVFAHDHKFRRIDGRIFSPGGLPNDVFLRYTKVFGKVTVIARILDEQSQNPKYSEITNEDVTILEKDALQEAVREADGVIARLPSILGALAIREAKKQKKPYLVEVVGCVWDAYWNYGWKGKAAAPGAFLYMRSLVRKAPFVVYVTNHFLQERYPTKGKQTNCSNVNISKAPEAVLEARLSKIRKAESPIVIGTTAAIDVPYKGQRFVLEALGTMQDQDTNRFLYQMVGGGDNTALAACAKELGVEDQAEWKGSMPHDRVIEWLDTIDVYIQPSLQEGLPRALIEAMSRGLPCIGTNAGGTGELLDRQYVISTKKNDRIGGAIAAALKKLCVAEEMERQARRNFEEANTYYIDTVIEKKRTEMFQAFLRTF